MTEKITIDRALIEQAIAALPDALGTSLFLLRQKLRAALAQPAAEPDKLGAEWSPCIKLPVVVHVRHQRPGEQHVSTREGITPVKPDDLIMRGVSGEEYPIGRAIFEQTYTFDISPPPQRPLVKESLTTQMLSDDEIAQAWW